MKRCVFVFVSANGGDCVCVCVFCDTMGGGVNADTVYITSFIVIEET